VLGKKYPPEFPEGFQREILFLEQQPKFAAAVDAENSLDAQSAAEVRTAGDFGAKPLIVLTAGNPYAGDEDDDLLSAEQKTRRDNLWIQHLRDGQYLVVPNKRTGVACERAQG
jgi:hypothetical protein